jgi:hypothetical protein
MNASKVSLRMSTTRRLAIWTKNWTKKRNRILRSFWWTVWRRIACSALHSTHTLSLQDLAVDLQEMQPSFLHRMTKTKSSVKRCLVVVFKHQLEVTLSVENLQMPKIKETTKTNQPIEVSSTNFTFKTPRKLSTWWSNNTRATSSIKFKLSPDKSTLRDSQLILSITVTCQQLERTDQTLSTW